MRDDDFLAIVNDQDYSAWIVPWERHLVRFILNPEDMLINSL